MKEQTFMVTCRFPVSIVPPDLAIVTAETVCKDFGGTICELLDDRLDAAGGLQIDDIVAITPVDDRTIAAAPVFTYNGTCKTCDDGTVEALDGSVVKCSDCRPEYEERGHAVHLEHGPRVALIGATRTDHADYGPPNIHFERKPDGRWSLLIAQDDGDPFAEILMADDGSGSIKDIRGMNGSRTVMEW